MFQQVGRLLLIVGLTAAAVGGVLYTLGRFGEAFHPLGTCIALSIVLMLVLYLLGKFRK